MCVPNFIPLSQWILCYRARNEKPKLHAQFSFTHFHPTLDWWGKVPRSHGALCRWCLMHGALCNSYLGGDVNWPHATIWDSFILAALRLTNVRAVICPIDVFLVAQICKTCTSFKWQTHKLQKFYFLEGCNVHQLVTETIYLGIILSVVTELTQLCGRLASSEFLWARKTWIKCFPQQHRSVKILILRV